VSVPRKDGTKKVAVFYITKLNSLLMQTDE